MQTTKGAKRPGAERKRPDRRPTKQAQPKKAGPQTAQQTIPYRELFKDGICRVNDRFYIYVNQLCVDGIRHKENEWYGIAD